jgi:hypothetical protein
MGLAEGSTCSIVCRRVSDDAEIDELPGLNGASKEVSANFGVSFNKEQAAANKVFI